MRASVKVGRGPVVGNLHGDSAGVGWSITGQAGDPCVVLLHGVFFGRRSWQFQVEALSASYRVLAIDLPGHGDLRDVPFTLAGAAGWVAEVLDLAGVGQAVVVGWSLGGFVALEVAATAPDRVTGLVLTGASMEPHRFLRGPGRLATRILGRAPSRVSAGVAVAIIRLLYGPDPAAILASSAPTVPEGMRALSGLPKGGFWDRLAGYVGPVLILNGAGDHIVRPGQEGFLRACRAGVAMTIPDAGHLAPVESPAAFNAALVRFIEIRRADRVPSPADAPGD